MRKSLLNLYLQKVSSGDLEYIDRLCSQLADRLIYAPIANSSETPGSAKTTFAVVKLTEAHRSLVPVFTTEEGLKKWITSSSHSGSSISLLGADFCAALGNKSWLVVDPGSDLSVELQPSFVVKIASAESSAEKVTEPEVKVEAKQPMENKVIKVKDTKSSDTQELMKPASITSTNISRPVMPKTSEQQVVPQPNEQPKKVEKKKSFLNFLKNK